MSNDLRYPVGKFRFPKEVSASELPSLIAQIAETPADLRRAVEGLDAEKLDTPYRDGGWTVRQVVHHLPDSHLNSYVRFKLALTEDNPTIKPYDEAQWANLDDAKNGPIDGSLAMLDALHERWVRMLSSLSTAELARTFQHPELGPVRLDQNIALYAWHGRHHVAHVTALREREGW